MATIVFDNAQMLLNGAELTSQLHDLSVDYKAEILDQTVMGNDTRTKRGGLYVGSIQGKGFFNSAVNLDSIFFNPVGSDLAVSVNPAVENGAQIEDTLFAIFPDGVTVGSYTTGCGFAMKGVVEKFTIGQNVGTLLDIDFAAQSRGIGA